MAKFATNPAHQNKSRRRSTACATRRIGAISIWIIFARATGALSTTITIPTDQSAILWQVAIRLVPHSCVGTNVSGSSALRFVVRVPHGTWGKFLDLCWSTMVGSAIAVCGGDFVALFFSDNYGGIVRRLVAQAQDEPSPAGRCCCRRPRYDGPRSNRDAAWSTQARVRHTTHHEGVTCG